MWRCIQCGEKNEGAYKSCWQCEAHKDGRPKPKPAPKLEPTPDVQDTVLQVALPDNANDEGLKTSLSNRFVCRCCGHKNAKLQDPPQLLGVISASCSTCSYTEFYQSEILLRQGEAALDLLFGPRVVY